MKDAELNQISMTILTQSGNAKKAIQKALVAMEQFNDSEVEINEQLKSAKDFLIEAHKAQNQAISHSDTLHYSLLFTHAQDTLMNTEESLFLVQHLVKIIKKNIVK